MRQDGGGTPSVVSILVPREEARKVEGRVCAPEPSSKDAGGGTPLDVSGIEEIREGLWTTSESLPLAVVTFYGVSKHLLKHGLMQPKTHADKRPKQTTGLECMSHDRGRAEYRTRKTWSTVLVQAYRNTGRDKDHRRPLATRMRPT